MGSNRSIGAFAERGITAVSEATRLSHNTIRSRLAELTQLGDSRVKTGMIRSSGGGRKPLTENDASLKQDLDSLGMSVQVAATQNHPDGYVVKA